MPWFGTVITITRTSSRIHPQLATSALLWRAAARVGFEAVGCQEFLGLRSRLALSSEVAKAEEAWLHFAIARVISGACEGAWGCEQVIAGLQLLTNCGSGAPGHADRPDRAATA